MAEIRKLKKRKCAVVGCTNTNKRTPELHFFTLPKDPARRLHWLKLMGRQDLFNRNEIRFRVCSAHFESSSMTVMNKLKNNVLPTKLLYQQPQEGTACDGSADLPQFCTCPKIIKTAIKRKLSMERRKAQYKLNEIYHELRFLTKELKANNGLDDMDFESFE